MPNEDILEITDIKRSLIYFKDRVFPVVYCRDAVSHEDKFKLLKAGFTLLHM